MVIDTSIVIEHIRAENKETTTLFKLFNKFQLFISSVTVYELFIGANTKAKEFDVKLSISGIIVLPFTDATSMIAAHIFHQLKQHNQLIEFRDIFIAATCLANELPIATLNQKHFKRIDGLSLFKGF